MKSSWLKNNIKATARLIRQSRKIIIACHMNPDGDALGSMLGIGIGLSKLGKSVVMLCPDPVPYRYAALPGVYRVKQQWREPADLAISVDCGSISQLSKLDEVFKKSKRIVEIDHHSYRTQFGDIQLIDWEACSVGEIVYLLLRELKVSIDKKIAECLLTSAIVESSSFSRQDVKRVTFEICAALMRTGVNYRKVSERYYWRKKLSAALLSGLCLNRIKTRANGRLAWSIVYKKDFEKFHGMQEDVDPVADDMMMIENLKIALLFREIENNTLRVSLRSKEGIDIGYFASMYGGGGHYNVAGCRIHNNKKTLERFINQAANLIYRQKRQIKK